jgi:hypothetical protein
MGAHGTLLAGRFHTQWCRARLPAPRCRRPRRQNRRPRLSAGAAAHAHALHVGGVGREHIHGAASKSVRYGPNGALFAVLIWTEADHAAALKANDATTEGLTARAIRRYLITSSFADPLVERGRADFWVGNLPQLPAQRDPSPQTYQDGVGGWGGPYSQSAPVRPPQALDLLSRWRALSRVCHGTQTYHADHAGEPALRAIASCLAARRAASTKAGLGCFCLLAEYRITQRKRP